EQLKDMIKNGRFPPNTTLPSEFELSELFNVSRSPVREALSVLSAVGIIETRQGGKTWVNNIDYANMVEKIQFEMMTENEILNLLEMRIIVESEAADLAAKRYNSQDLEQLEESLSNFKEILSDDELIGFEADFSFHKSIVRASHNPFLFQTVENLSFLHLKAIKYSLSKNLGWNWKRKEVTKEHEQIYYAIKNRDPENAKHIVKNHLTNVIYKLKNN